MKRLRRKKNFTKREKKEIAKKMLKGYEKMSEVDDEFIQKFSLFEDEAK